MGVSMNLRNLPVSFVSLYQQCFATFSGVDRKVVMIDAVCWAIDSRDLQETHGWDPVNRRLAM